MISEPPLLKLRVFVPEIGVRFDEELGSGCNWDESERFELEDWMFGEERSREIEVEEDSGWFSSVKSFVVISGA